HLDLVLQLPLDTAGCVETVQVVDELGEVTGAVACQSHWLIDLEIWIVRVADHAGVVADRLSVRTSLTLAIWTELDLDLLGTHDLAVGVQHPVDSTRLTHYANRARAWIGHHSRQLRRHLVSPLDFLFVVICSSGRRRRSSTCNKCDHDSEDRHCWFH